MNETFEQQMRDSDMIFTQVSTSALANMEEAQRLIVMLFVRDMTVSRAGISHALKRLERFYDAEAQRKKRANVLPND